MILHRGQAYQYFDRLLVVNISWYVRHHSTVEYPARNDALRCAIPQGQDQSCTDAIILSPKEPPQFSLRRRRRPTILIIKPHLTSRLHTPNCISRIVAPRRNCKSRIDPALQTRKAPLETILPVFEVVRMRLPEAEVGGGVRVDADGRVIGNTFDAVPRALVHLHETFEH